MPCKNKKGESSKMVSFEVFPSEINDTIMFPTGIPTDFDTSISCGATT
jgi:hypothetical protein